MTDKQPLSKRLADILGDKALNIWVEHGEVTLEVAPQNWQKVCRELHDHADLKFEQLTDLCGVDYLSYGDDEWETTDVSSEGFSRGVDNDGPGRLGWADSKPQDMERRFAAVLHLLSITHNARLRVRAFCEDSQLPSIASVVDVWSAADWFEREAFDLYGILFEGHPDLRRILTDYGFVGHPFRKDFPLSGNVEVRYDEELKRVVYEPTDITPRVLVPRVIRNDARYNDVSAVETGGDHE